MSRGRLSLCTPSHTPIHCRIHMHTHMCTRVSAVCQLNVHKRCERMVPHNCGINQRELSQALQDMGVTPDRLRPGSKSLSSVCEMHMHTHTHAHTHTCTCTCMHTHAHAYTHAQHMHTHAHTAHTHAHAHMHTHMHNTCTHTCTTHAHTHACTHMHIMHKAPVSCFLSHSLIPKETLTLLCFWVPLWYLRTQC